jgi:pseudouridine synthase
LLTNDGRITHRLLHPSFEHEKEYLVTTYGKIDDHVIQALRAGVRYSISEGPKTPLNNKGQTTPTKYQKPNIKNNLTRSITKFVQTNPCEVKRVSSDTFTIILTEGKNRQIRRMVEACGHQVKRLKRIRIEHILLADLPDGAYRELKRGEREELLRRSALPLVDFAPLVGEVVHGDGRGHEIGFPTANIVVAAGTFPDKTFSCRVKVGERLFLGAGSYQVKKGHFEVHIINFNEDIYGQTLHVEILDFIRDNRPFKDIAELKTQIEKDVNHVRAHWRAVLRGPDTKERK